MSDNSSKEIQWAIKVEDVSLDIAPSNQRRVNLKKKVLQSATGGLLSVKKGRQTVQALRNVSCVINEGSRVALLGHNGAGKSTFLRVISGIYMPSKGRVLARHKVHPMIHKGIITGVELSGFDAIKGHYLLQHGSLLGFDSFAREVVEFSEIGDFINLPVKSYSEGMFSRLVFSILTTESHKCLALDEGFGTGDAAFQEKAQKRLETFMKRTSTLVLASHSESLIRKFCTRGLVFKHGSVIFDGDIEEAYKALYSA